MVGKSNATEVPKSVGSGYVVWSNTGKSVPIIEIPGVITAMQGGFGASGAQFVAWNSFQSYDDAVSHERNSCTKVWFCF